MRILFVWLTTVSVVFVITVGWYIGLELTVKITEGFLGSVTGQALSLTGLIGYAAILWGPLFDIIVIAWAIVNSQAIDPISERYS